MSTNSLNDRPPMEHKLKLWERHFDAVLSGAKKAEHRVLDRDFRVGDTLCLEEVTEFPVQYTGRKVYVTITYITSNSSMAVLSIEPQDTKEPARSEISVKSVFTDEADLKAQISKERMGQIEAHADEGGIFPNAVVIELINHIHAVERVRDEWCMEYVKLRDNKPVLSREQFERVRQVLLNGFEYRNCEEWTKAILKTAGVAYVG